MKLGNLLCDERLNIHDPVLRELVKTLSRLQDQHDEKIEALVYCTQAGETPGVIESLDRSSAYLSRLVKAAEARVISHAEHLLNTAPLPISNGFAELMNLHSL